MFGLILGGRWLESIVFILSIATLKGTFSYIPAYNFPLLKITVNFNKVLY